MNRVTPETHRLTDIEGEKHPMICQSCGGSDDPAFGNGLIRHALLRWQECDHNDQPEPRLLALCNKCSARLIEQHPRLYRSIDPNAPWPGCMRLCIDCRYRQGVSCTHPKSKLNGGPGLAITCGRPLTAFVDGTRGGRRTGWVEQVYTTPPTACEGKEP
jgi:hypothetical protein